MTAESFPCQSGSMVICNDVARLPGGRVMGSRCGRGWATRAVAAGLRRASGAFQPRVPSSSVTPVLAGGMITGMTAQAYRPFLDILVAHTDLPLPEGCDTWGWKTVRPDLRTHGGFRWPWPGGAVSDPHATPGNDPCPTADTGGFCVAKNWYGA